MKLIQDRQSAGPSAMFSQESCRHGVRLPPSFSLPFPQEEDDTSSVETSYEGCAGDRESLAGSELTEHISDMEALAFFDAGELNANYNATELEGSQAERNLASSFEEVTANLDPASHYKPLPRIQNLGRLRRHHMKTQVRRSAAVVQKNLRSSRNLSHSSQSISQAELAPLPLLESAWNGKNPPPLPPRKHQPASVNDV